MNNKFLIKARCFVKGSFVGNFKMLMSIHNMGSLLEAEKEVEKRIPYASTTEKAEIIKDMVNMAKNYHYGYDEYFYFHFREKTINERLAFFPDILQRIVVRDLNKPSNQYLFDDKGSCADCFAKYYKRDFCVIYNIWPKNWRKIINNKILVFLRKHQRFIVKPLTSGCGKGVKIFNSKDFHDDVFLADYLIKEYCKGIRGGFICEELIEQDERMAQFHPSSVNTVRLTTVKFPDRIDVIHAFMRIGQKGNIVDNGGAGGLLCTIDMNTGKIIASADEEGIFYTNHPDSGLNIVGFKIPEWENAVNLAKELATVVKDNRYTGWDLALTKDRGWVMVEGNAMGQFVGWQIPTQKGFRDELNHILEELHLKPYLAE